MTTLDEFRRGEITLEELAARLSAETARRKERALAFLKQAGEAPTAKEAAMHRRFALMALGPPGVI